MKTDSTAVPQSLSLSLSWKHSSVSPLVLHPSLLRHHPSNRARQLGSLPPLTPASFAFCHRRINASGCFVGCVQSQRTRMSDTTRQRCFSAQYKSRATGHFRNFCLTMPIAIQESKLLQGMKVAQVGMLLDRLWEHSRVPQRSVM